MFNKRNLKSVVVVSGLVVAAANATPVNGTDGVEFGNSDTFIKNFFTYQNNLQMRSTLGGISLYAGYGDYGPTTYDGGLKLEGSPVRVVLGAAQESPAITEGTFQIWSAAGFPSGTPLLSIDSDAETAIYSGLDVSISDGTLTVGGSPVVTQANVPTILGGLTGNLDIGNGTVSSTGSVAIGLNSPVASGSNSVAIGGGTASGPGAIALAAGTAGGPGSLVCGTGSAAWGTNSVALGPDTGALGTGSVAFASGVSESDYSLAASGGNADSFGTYATALSGGWTDAHYSVSAGKGTKVNSFSGVALGLYNDFVSGNRLIWRGQDALLSVGNGTGDTSRSDAVRILKNGQTTLINKKWSSTTPLDDPDALDSNDAGGEALNVKGHTTLEGKVTVLTRQGDISMGIYD